MLHVLQVTSVLIGGNGESVHSGAMLYTATVLVLGGVTHQYTDVTVALVAGATVLAQSVLERNEATRSDVLLQDVSVVYFAPPRSTSDGVSRVAHPHSMLRVCDTRTAVDRLTQMQCITSQSIFPCSIVDA